MKRFNLFVFDIETIPDTDSARKIYNFSDNLSDEAVGEALFTMRRQAANGAEFLPLHMHKIVCISAAFYNGNQFKVWSLGDEDSGEAEIIKRFFSGLEKYRPTLVSWNGKGFDAPVLHYRSLVHGVSAPQYWEVGETDQSFKWNNYLNRYHYRHLDVMDILAGFQPRANAPLDQIATQLGFPGKMGMDGSKVFSAYLKGDIQGIRNYCETDVLNTLLVYLKFELIRGQLTEEQYETELEQIQNWLTTENKPHFEQFLIAWRNN